MTILRGAEPFLLPGGERGVLLIHGFTGSPSEMRLMGEHLNRQGFTVLGPRLTGHGTSPDDMARTRWPDWYGEVENGYHLLRGLCAEINVAGLSLGGLLGMKLTAEYPVAKLVSVNAPIIIADKRLPFLPILRVFRAFETRRRRQLELNDAYNVCYDRVPLTSLTSMLAFIKHVDGLLPSIDRPALLIQSRHDHTVRPASVEHIYRRLGGSDKRIVWLERSGHVATLDVEYEQVFRYITDFFAVESANN